MELLLDLNTAKGLLGLISFVLLIVWLRWEGPVEDQKKDEPSQVPKEREHQAKNDD